MFEVVIVFCDSYHAFVADYFTWVGIFLINRLSIRVGHPGEERALGGETLEHLPLPEGAPRVLERDSE